MEATVASLLDACLKCNRISSFSDSINSSVSHADVLGRRRDNDGCSSFLLLLGSLLSLLEEVRVMVMDESRR